MIYYLVIDIWHKEKWHMKENMNSGGTNDLFGYFRQQKYMGLICKKEQRISILLSAILGYVT
jgi:hypothetical protein